MRVMFALDWTVARDRAQAARPLSPTFNYTPAARTPPDTPPAFGQGVRSPALATAPPRSVLGADVLQHKRFELRPQMGRNPCFEPSTA